MAFVLINFFSYRALKWNTELNMRKLLIAANWKMYKTPSESTAFLTSFYPLIKQNTHAEIVLCPAMTSLPALVDAARSKSVFVGAQNMHWKNEGAFTGETSPVMLAAIGASHVLIGHSERRQYFNETDRALQEKVPAALAAGLEPMLCVGESEDEREAGQTQRKLRHQVQEALVHLTDARLADVTVAYEPIWAIGTGRVATPDQAQEAIAFIRALVGDRSEEAAQAVRVLYGGSVNAENAGEILSQPDVDGALVGGASLDPEEFARIVGAAVT